MHLPDPASLPRPWVASYPPGVPPTYTYPDVPLSRFLDDAARDFPDTAALWARGRTVSYADLLDRVDRLATALSELGIGRGDRVALHLPNVPGAVVAAFATWRLGGVLVPVHPEVDATALRDALASSRAGVAVCLSAALAELDDLRASLPDLRHLVTTDPDDPPTRARRLLAGVASRLRRPVVDVEEVHPLVALTDRSDPIAKQEPLEPGDTAIVQFVGPPGRRRGVVLTHGNLTASAFQARLWIADTQAGRERLLAGVPFATVHGLSSVLAGVLSAATLVVVDHADPEAVLAAVDRARPTLLAGTPDLYGALVGRTRRHDLSSLRACTSGGGPADPDVVHRFEAASGARLREVWGMAESAALSHANPIYGRVRRGTVGLPVTDTVAAVVDDDGAVVPTGRAGRLVVAGPQVAAGYWGSPGGGPQRLHSGWLVTDRTATVDEDGYFSLVGDGR